MTDSTNLSNILLNNRTAEEDAFYTHVSMLRPFGKFNLSRNILDEDFWPTYCSAVFNASAESEEKEETMLGVAERSQAYMPVLGDVDIKLKSSDIGDIDVRQMYTQEQLEQVVSAFQSVLRDILSECKATDLTCFVLEKPARKTIKNDVEWWKRGFHLHFPVFMNKVDLQVHFYPRVKKIIQDARIFSELGFANSGDLVDTNVCTVPWLLYGSRKDENNPSYVLTRIYDADMHRIELAEACAHLRVFDQRENEVDISGQELFYIPRILSVIPFGRETRSVVDGLQLPAEAVAASRAMRKKKTVAVDIVSVEKRLKEASVLMPMLADVRATRYIDWMTVGWALYNVGEGCDEAMDMWIEFSRRDAEKFNEAACIYQWDRMTKRNMTLGTLKHFAAQDSPEQYRRIVSDQITNIVQQNLEESTNYDIARMLYVEFNNEFVCSSVSGNTWYQFVHPLWTDMEDGIFLRNYISTTVWERYQSILDVLKADELAAQENEDFEEKKRVQSRIKACRKVMRELRSSGTKRSIMNECKDQFYDREFAHKLDMDPYIIAFKNGIYDLNRHEFREGRPEDFVSKSLTIDYPVDKLESDDSVHEVYEFMEKLFPDSDLREYVMDQVSDLFVGGNFQKVVNFWTGDGDNGKSVFQTIIQKLFGKLAIKFSTTVLTGKRPGPGAANADMARAGGGVRVGTAEETESDEMINTGQLKYMTGNDSFYARDLFEKGKDTREVTPMFNLIIICNKLPRMKNADNATWNRVRVIPFESTFCRADNPAPETYEEQLRQKRFPMDPNFSAKIPAMLPAFAWVMLEHRKTMCVRHVPDKVLAATDVYRKANDVYKQFCDDRVVKDARGRVYATDLMTQFKEWAKLCAPGYVGINKDALDDYFFKAWGAQDFKSGWMGYRVITDVRDRPDFDADESIASAGSS